VNAGTTTPQLVQRPRESWTDELRRDLIAVGLDGHGTIDVDAVQTRPALLRQIAALAAAHVPATIARLVAATADAPLATALALHTGLPFALLDDTVTRHGELYPSEQVVAVATLDVPDVVTGTVELIGAHVHATIAVVATGTQATAATSRGQDGIRTYSLFALADLRNLGEGNRR
jgi:orotate phosphoribosyltransferase